MRPDEADRPGADVDDLATQLSENGTPYATVTVVRREPPVSANVGDRAIVTTDGELHGWIGGVACAQSIAIREAIKAIEQRGPSLIGIAPDPETVDRPGLESYPMTCHSEGVLELFVEPVVTATRLVLIGDSPIVHALARMAPEVAFDVTIVTNEPTDAAKTVPIDDRSAVEAAVEDTAFALIASMGAYDEEMLAVVLAADCPYIGLVASDDRADIVCHRVAERTDLEPEDIRAQLDQPAGIDIGAGTPEEIAVSILAQLISERQEIERLPVSAPATTEAEPSEEAIDPVCGMTVEVARAAATYEHEGTTYAFCGQGCAEAFESDPDRFAVEVE